MPRGGQNRGSGKAPPKGGKLPKGAGRRGAPSRLTQEQYEKLWVAYCGKQQIQHAAKAAGCSHKTAKKYIDGKGDPSRGMVPIHQRWLELESKARRRADNALVKARSANLKLVKLAKSKLTEKLLNKFDLDNISEDKVPSALKDLILLEERLLGGDDLKVGVRKAGVGLEFAGWTLEEMLEFARTGKEPAREIDLDDDSSASD